MKTGELSPSPTSPVATWAGEIYPFYTHPHYLSVPEPGVRTESEVTITARELSLLPPTATFGRAGPVPHLGNTVQPTMLVKLWVNQTQTEM